jgi:hypothetical protein
LIAIAALSLAPLTAALAEKAEVPELARSWYWEPQRSEKAPNPTGGDAAAAELPNPFCPGTPGLGNAPGDACRYGRLPVEVVGGDYETPDKISAIAFDFATVLLPGSEVSKFTVTLDEANDPQSQPVNADNKRVQACLLSQFFGDGEAREYKEAPKFKCTKSDPIAERKEIKPKKDGDPTFVWTFDLTDFAKVWAKGKSPVAGVMLFPAEPKKPESQDNSDWRVVFKGPDDKGVHTEIVYTQAAVEPIPQPPSDDNDTTSNGGGSGDGSTTVVPPATGTDGSTYSSTPVDSGSFGSTTSSPVGGTTGTGTVTPDTAATPEAPVQAAPGSEPTADVTEVESLPGYVWLAILGGLIGFSLVKRTVIESATGARPDGVLAQIRNMNAERRGGAAPVTTGGSGLSNVFKNVGSGARGLAGRLRFGKKG